MTPVNPVGVQHGNNHENKIFPEQSGSVVISIEKEFNYSVHAMACWGLPRMHPGSNKNNHFISPISKIFN